MLYVIVGGFMQYVIKTIIWLVIASLTIFSHIGYSRSNDFPRGCEPKGFEFIGENVKLHHTAQEDAPQQTLYLLHNTSSKRLKIQNKVDKQAIVAPVWNVELNRYRWAAFATNKKEVIFRCKNLYRRANESSTSCQEVIEICQYPRAKFSISNYGTYWVTSNKSLNQTIRKAIKKGILLRW